MCGYGNLVWRIVGVVLMGMLAGGGVTATTTEMPVVPDVRITVEPVTLPPVNPAEVTGAIIVAGSPTVVPLAEQIAKQFRSEGFSDSVAVASIGTSSGFERFCVTIETDIAGADRLITAEEFAACRQNDRTPVRFRLGSAAPAVMVSAANDFVTDVTSAELAALFSTAEVWRDVRPEWPAEPIQRFIPGTDRLTFDIFVGELFEYNEDPLLQASNVQLSDDNDILAQAISDSPYAIGFFSYADADRQRDQLTLLSIGGIAPTLQTIEAGSFPLARALYFYSDAGIMQDRPQVAAFLNYALTNVNEQIAAINNSDNDAEYIAAGTATLNQSKRTWLIAMGLIQLDERVYLPLVGQGATSAARR